VFYAEVINYEFDRKDVLSLGLCSIVGVWYLWKRVSILLFISVWYLGKRVGILGNQCLLVFGIWGREWVYWGLLGNQCLLVFGIWGREWVY